MDNMPLFVFSTKGGIYILNQPEGKTEEKSQELFSSWLSRSRMGFEIDIFELLVQQLGIYLSR